MSSLDDTLKERLMQDNGSFDAITEEPPTPLYERRSLFRQYLLPFSLHLTFALLYTAVATTLIYSKGFAASPGPTQVYSPAQKAKDLQLQYYNSNQSSPYSGLPSATLDAAWHDLLQYANMRFSITEMKAIDPDGLDQAVALPDEGYFGSLTVFHELHCLKRLHRYMYPSTYFPGLSDEEKEDNRYHNEHCIDMLRQSVMCHGDITPVTMRWGQTQPIPLADVTGPHQCVNWAKLNQWAKERSVKEVLRPGYLKHPKFGVVVGDDFDNRVGQVHHGE